MFSSLLRKMLLYILGLVAVWFICRWYRETKRVSNKGDKYVYITGCDSGFGNLLARHLDKLGFPVIAACYTEKGEDELKKNTSDTLTTVHLDVTDSDSVNSVAAQIKSLVGQKGEWLIKQTRHSMFFVAVQAAVSPGCSFCMVFVFLWCYCRSVGCCEQCWSRGALRSD